MVSQTNDYNTARNGHHRTPEFSYDWMKQQRQSTRADSTRELKQTTTTTARETSPNKRFN